MKKKIFKSTSNVCKDCQSWSCRIRSIRKFQVLRALCDYILFTCSLFEEIEYSPANRSYSQTNANFISEYIGFLSSCMNS
jgi:hypothetical protein